MEAHEIREFSKQMQEAGEGESTRSISLAISILAVLVAVVTVLGHRSHTGAVLEQARAGDQWNEYQARKIRAELVLGNVDLLTLQPGNDLFATQRKITEYRAHLDEWHNELDEELKKARDLEAEVDRAEARASRYDLGEALLQIAVVLASITLLTRRRLYFFFGLSLGAAGLLAAASALLVH